MRKHDLIIFCLALAFGLCAYTLGVLTTSQDRTVKIRGNCDATEVYHLKPGYYTEVKN